ncbi:MAG: sulfite exporter TauE/SafE family protein [Halanaeroarchaeum sp.]
MPVAGVSVVTIATFAGFGALVGLIFGFFGMGSFLVTPTLLVMGYDSTVAVGSGLAFVFGTAVIATLKHRDLGQVAPTLGVTMIAGTTLGLEVGRQGLLALKDAGIASGIVGGSYVLLLGTVGTIVVRDALGKTSPGGADEDTSVDEVMPDRLAWLNDIPPRIGLPGGGSASIWLLFVVMFLIGVPAGLLGIGGGFIRIPALTYLIGVPMSAAVGTNVFALAISGGFGTFSYAQMSAVDLSIVGPLLVGSAFGARLGSTITDYVDEDDSKGYFGGLLLVSAVAVAVRHVGSTIGNPLLQTAGFWLIVGAAVLVASLVVLSAIRTIRTEGPAAASAD